MRNAFGKPFMDRQWFESRRKVPGYLPTMAIQVTSPQGRCVSYAEAHIDWKQNFAEIGPLATHPDYQCRGLAGACLAEMFRRLSAMEVRDAYMRSDMGSAASIRLLDRLLPVERQEEHSWELVR
jgi:ribosomal protein S18 acetylase RimI-like enzyme